MQESHMYKMYKRILNIRLVILIINLLSLVGSFIFPENIFLRTVLSAIFYFGTVAFFYFTGWLDGYRKFENEEEK